MITDLTCRVVLEKPPPDVDFGLQKGSGSKYETVQRQKTKLQDLFFVFDIKIKGSRDKNPSPDFSGPYVQGNAGSRFIYLDIGTYAGVTDSPWGRRLKIPLTGISWDMINKIDSDEGLIIETHVPGTGKDGGPNCATVKPFAGWQVKNFAES